MTVEAGSLHNLFVVAALTIFLFFIKIDSSKYPLVTVSLESFYIALLVLYSHAFLIEYKVFLVKYLLSAVPDLMLNLSFVFSNIRVRRFLDICLEKCTLASFLGFLK